MAATIEMSPDTQKYIDTLFELERRKASLSEEIAALEAQGKAQRETNAALAKEGEQNAGYVEDMKALGDAKKIEVGQLTARELQLQEAVKDLELKLSVLKGEYVDVLQAALREAKKGAGK